MINNQVVKAIDSLPGKVFIEKLWWIGASLQSNDIPFFIKDFNKQDLTNIFPEIYHERLDKYFQINFDPKFFVEFEKLGFIAMVRFSVCSGFSYTKEGNPVSWSVSRVTDLKYLYAETTDQLMEEIKIASAKIFLQFQENDKKKKNDAGTMAAIIAST